MKQILLFLRRPQAVELKESKTALLFKAFLFMVLINWVFGLIMFGAKAIGFEALATVFKDQQWPTHYGRTTLLLYIVLLGPVVEEFAFRGWFTTNRWLSLISLMILSYLFLKILGVHRLTGHKTIVYPALVLMSGAAIYRYIPSIILYVRSHTQPLAIISVSAFAAVHIFNFNLQSEVPLPSLVVCMAIILVPYFFKGLALMWARITLGLPWSIALHILNNALVLLFLL